MFFLLFIVKVVVAPRSPFRDGRAPSVTVNGSGDPGQFAGVFEELLAKALPADLSTLSVKQLQQALSDRRISSHGCSEKADLVALLEQA